MTKFKSFYASMQMYRAFAGMCCVVVRTSANTYVHDADVDGASEIIKNCFVFGVPAARSRVRFQFPAKLKMLTGKKERKLVLSELPKRRRYVGGLTRRTNG